MYKQMMRYVELVAATLTRDEDVTKIMCYSDESYDRTIEGIAEAMFWLEMDFITFIRKPEECLIQLNENKSMFIKRRNGKKLFDETGSYTDPFIDDSTYILFEE